MAKTIANFLVGVGLDTKDFDKGSHNVETSLGGMRSKAALAGSAIAAAFSAASIAAINAGNNADKFALKVEKFDTSRRFIYNLGNAFKLMGGNAEDAIGAVAKAEGVLDALRKGDASAIESAALSQANVLTLQTAVNGEDFLRKLSDIMPGLEKWQQRSLAETFGLSDAALKTLKDGSGRLDAIIAQVDKYADNLDAAAEAGRAYNFELARSGMIMEEISQKLAKGILPQFTNLLAGFNDFIEKNAPKVNAAINYISENSGAVSAIGGGLAVGTTGAAIGGAASKLGMRGLATLGRGAAIGGAAGAAAGVGSLLYSTTASDIKDVTGYDVSKYYRSPSETVEAIGKWLKGGYESKARSGSRSDVMGDTWIKGGAVTPEKAAAASPTVQTMRAEASKPTMSQMARSDASIPPALPPINVNSTITLDSRVLGKSVQQINASDYYDARTEQQSTTKR